jgi:hypothetical protein
MEYDKKQVFAAAMLAIIAMVAIAYAQNIMGTVTLTTVEPVTVSNITDTFPARSAGVRTYPNIIALELSSSNGFRSGDDVVVRVELVPYDAKVYAGFRSLVIQILYAANVRATLTLQTPYSDFTLENIATQLYSFDVVVIFATGKEPVTATLGLKVTIVGILP